VDGADVKSPHGSLLSTGVRVEAGAPKPPPLLTGALSSPPNRSMLDIGGTAAAVVEDTGLITEVGAGRRDGTEAAPGGGGRRRGLAPRPIPPGREGLSFFRSMLRLTLMVWPSLKARSRLGLEGSFVMVSLVKMSSFLTWNEGAEN